MEKIIMHKFNTVAEYVSYLDTTRFNPKNHNRKSRAQSEHRTEFTGTETYEQAQELLANGDKNLAAKLETKSASVGNNVKNLVQGLIAKRKRDIAGSIPNVAAYLNGNPRNMIRRERVKTETKIVNIVYLNSFHWMIEQWEVENAGTNMLYCIRELERAGYRVNLYIGAVSWVRNHPWGYVINVKNSGQYLNVEKLAYLMAHPSALRRHGFRMMEVEQEIVFLSDYGTKLDDKKVIDEMMKSVNIQNAQVVTFYDLQDKDAKETCELVTGDKK